MATKAQQQAERIKQLEKQVPTHKTQSLPKRGTAELQNKIKEEQTKAITTLAKTSVGERRAEDFKQKFGVDPKSVLSGLTKLDNKTPTKPERTIPAIQSDTLPTQKQKEKQAEILDPIIYAPGGGGASQPTSFMDIQPDAQFDKVLIDLKQNLLQSRIDDIINEIFKEIDVSGLTLSDRLKVSELPNLESEYNALMAFHVTPSIDRTNNDARIAAFYKAQEILQKIESIKALKIKVDVVLKFEELINNRVKELNDWISEPTFNPNDKEKIMEKIKELSRITENALIRNVQLKEGLISQINKAQVDALEKIRKAEQDEINRIKFIQEQRKEQKPKIIDADDFLDKPLDKTLQSNVNWENFAKIFTAQFDSSPEKWAKVIVDQAKGAEMAQKMLNQGKVGK